jgi:hypothetical protein
MKFNKEKNNDKSRHVQVALWKCIAHTKIKTKLEEDDRLYMEESNSFNNATSRYNCVLQKRLIIGT